MGFTVAHKGGTKDVDFSAYGRLLRQRGVDLARAPRTLEPGTGRRWLYVWDKEAEAKAFAAELKKRTGDRAWHVLPVDAPTSEGPLGPLEILLGRRTDGWAFALHPLSQAILQALFPDSGGAANVFIGVDRDGNHKIRDNFGGLVQQVAVILTGLKPEQLERLGYQVADAETDREVVLVPPGDARQG